MRSWPDAAAFDPEEGAASSALEAIVRGPGAALPAVLLVGAPDEWAIRSAAAIARAFVHSGRRIVLVEAGTSEPSLHDLLGVPNDEGLSDHFAFGTSLDRLARPVEDGSWSLVPAGPVLDGGAPAGTAAEWHRLIANAAVHEITLLVYAPRVAPGLPALAERIGAVIVLAPEGSSRLALERVVPRPYAVLAVFEPRSAEAVAAPAETLLATSHTPLAEVPPAPLLPRDSALRQELIADLRARQRAALREPPEPLVAGASALGTAGAAADVPGTAAPGDETAAQAALREYLAPEEPPVIRRAAAPRRGVRWALLAVLLMLSLAAGAWHLWSRWSEGRAAREAAVARATPVPEAPVPAASRPAPDSLDGPLPYLVAMEAYPLLPTAERRLLTLRNMQLGLSFLIAPLFREGTLYYHVMAGPVADSAAAGTLVDALIARRVKTASMPGDVRFAPLAFLLAEFPTRDSADARIARLRLLDIPAYAVPAGEPPRWRLYAGGYNGPAEADVMRQLLKSAGVPDSLVTRTGRISR